MSRKPIFIRKFTLFVAITILLFMFFGNIVLARESGKSTFEIVGIESNTYLYANDKKTRLMQLKSGYSLLVHNFDDSLSWNAVVVQLGDSMEYEGGFVHTSKLKKDKSKKVKVIDIGLEDATRIAYCYLLNSKKSYYIYSKPNMNSKKVDVFSGYLCFPINESSKIDFDKDFLPITTFEGVGYINMKRIQGVISYISYDNPAEELKLD